LLNFGVFGAALVQVSYLRGLGKGCAGTSSTD